MGTLAVLVFAWLSIQQVDDEHALTWEGQVTDRYNAAVTNIGEDPPEVRLGGIYALQRIMRDSPRDQPSIVNVLSTYIRNHAKKPKQAIDALKRKPTSDVQAALTALGSRNPVHDGTARVDLHGANLSGADLSGAYLHGADLSDANLIVADLSGADLSDANLSKANLSVANLSVADLSVADLRRADLPGAYLPDADLRDAILFAADLRDADLSGADLRGADLRNARR
ncbi:pentapeptide repeat-containing protein [Streptomyces sp. 5-8]|uniref:Pentapeptide repeat-containing protein n=1 Tax=Streptomyces musisoli TaxID=2802280 RepID=A0ABS1NWL1_9ACTN|nr:pentapeptide repeat-containing protein [Streptomyces musisoli]